MSSFNETITVNSLQHGQGTATATAAQLSGVVNKKAHKGVRIRHISGGSDTLYVGLEGLTTSNGYPLEDGQEIFLEIEDPTAVYVIGSDASVIYGWLSY